MYYILKTNTIPAQYLAQTALLPLMSAVKGKMTKSKYMAYIMDLVTANKCQEQSKQHGIEFEVIEIADIERYEDQSIDWDKFSKKEILASIPKEKFYLPTPEEVDAMKYIARDNEPYRTAYSCKPEKVFVAGQAYYLKEGIISHSFFTISEADDFASKCNERLEKNVMAYKKIAKMDVAFEPFATTAPYLEQVNIHKIGIQLHQYQFFTPDGAKRVLFFHSKDGNGSVIAVLANNY